MKGFAVLTMLFTLATACVSAESEVPEVSPAETEAALVAQPEAQEAGFVEGAELLLGPITISNFCEEIHGECVIPCSELSGHGRTACLLQCYRAYKQCIGGCGAALCLRCRVTTVERTTLPGQEVLVRSIRNLSTRRES